MKTLTPFKLRRLLASVFLLAMLGSDVSALTISKTFSAVGSGAAIAVKNGDQYTFSVSGTFVGTVILERSQNGNQSWTIVKTMTTTQSSTTLQADLANSGQAQYRFRCSAYTSGSIVTSIKNVDHIYSEIDDNSGNILFQVNDSGITASNVTLSSGGVVTGPYVSNSSNPASAGQVRLANADLIEFRNSTNASNLPFGVGSADGIAAFNSLDLVNVSSAQTLTNKTLTAPIVSTISNSGNTITFPTTTDTLVGRATSDTLTNKTLTSPAINTATALGGTYNALTGFSLRDTSAAFNVTLAATSSTTLTAGRTVTIDVKDAARAFNLQGDLSVPSSATVSGTNTGDVTIGTANGLSLSSQALSMALAASSVTGAVSATTQTFTGAKTFETQLIGKGTATNDSAAAGYIGEYMSASNAGASNFPTSGQWGDADSLSLTAGDWDVTFCAVATLGTATTVSLFDLGISQTTGNDTTGLSQGDNRLHFAGPNSTNDNSGCIVEYRQSLSGSATVYGKLLGSYSGGTPTYKYRLSARRAR